MKINIVILGLTLFFLPIIVFSRDNNSQYEYLIQTTNAIHEIQNRKLQLESSELREITARACNTLRRLRNDDYFLADLNRLASLAPDYREGQVELSHDIGKFLDSFLRPELELLHSAGLSEGAVVHISIFASYFHNSLGKDIDPVTILALLESLQNDICEVATTIDTDIKTVEKQKLWRSRITKWAMGISGAAVIAVDAGATVPSAGVSAASFTIGGARIGGAVAQ